MELKYYFFRALAVVIALTPLGLTIAASWRNSVGLGVLAALAWVALIGGGLMLLTAFNTDI